MDKTIKDLFTPDLLTEICARYGLTPAEITLLGSWQNFVYRFRRNDRGYILRVTHRSHRSPAMIESELDFVTYLAGQGVQASRPVGAMQTVGDFTATVFEEAPGGRPGEGTDWWELTRKIGRLTGRMHRLARDYQPSPGVARRFEWHQSDYLAELPRYVPAEQTGVHATLRDLMDQLHALPRDPSAYGLIHADIVVSNFFVQDGQIHIFDFDEAQYAWFANDLAISLFYAIPFPSDDREETARRYMAEYMEGYQQEHSLDRFWLKQMPLFLRLRQLVLYSTVYRSADLNSLSPWGRRFMEFSRTNLETGEPFIDYDFGA